MRRMFIIIIFGAILLMFACSNGSKPVTSENPSDNEIISGGQNLGEFSLALNSENLSATIEPLSRDGALNVTRYVKIKITGIQWDSVARIWDIDVTIENPTKYNAYGPWIIFYNTGQQKILDQDGFVRYGTSRYPVIAFCKENTERKFGPQSLEPVHLRIYWPVGCDRFNPMQFLMDVSFPGPRQQPIVEKLKIWQDSPIEEQFNLAGYIKDWQVAPQPPGLEVWVDLTPIGGDDHVLLYDDGNHHDGAAGDDIWGCDFMAVPPPDPLPLTVHALDWENYKFENDVIFGNINPPVCLPMVDIDSGQWGFHEPYEKIIRDPDSWKNFWATLHPGQDLPPVDFTIDQVVIAMTGWRSSSGYSVKIDCVKILADTQGNPFTSVTYTEMKPGQSCYVLWVIQYPYKIVSTPQTPAPDTFDHLINVYECD